jgi:hydrogenase maturation protein HypF
MLPYTPLHHMLLRELGLPIVATSGNRSDEPIAIDDAQALERLGEIADLFLSHDRPIVRPVDDSVVRTTAFGPVFLRRARGYAPLPVVEGTNFGEGLAVGGQLKNTIALSDGSAVFVSQHLGELDAAATFDVFRRTVDDLERILEVRPTTIACDRHPDYRSTRAAREFASASGAAPELVPVQHHFAHLASVLAEHGLEETVLGVIWDGTGLGVDGTVWGGEFLVGDRREFRRAGWLRRFRLPGGDAAAREPWRCAVAVLVSLGEREAALRFAAEVERGPSGSTAEPDRARSLLAMIDRGVRSPWCSSAGRLFDAAAALVGVARVNTFEGEAAGRLEALAWRAADEREAYPVEVRSAEAGAFEIDWGPAIRALLADRRRGVPAERIAARFHRALVAAILSGAEAAGRETVVLSGGCFQNRWLLEESIRRLRARGFRVYWNRHVPPGDGGLALGQLAVAAARIQDRPGEAGAGTGSERDDVRAGTRTGTPRTDSEDVHVPGRSR